MQVLPQAHAAQRDEVSARIMGKLVKFLREVVAEMKKVSWSTRRELVTYTGVVGIAIVVVCALIWICDTIFARIFQVILHY